MPQATHHNISPKRREWPRRIALLSGSALLTLLIAELVLRLFIDFPQRHYIWPPHTQIEFRPAPGLMPGITGVSRFTINSQGFRGDEIDGEDRYTILCLGGSTTECAFLDDTEAWPYLLQQNLNRASPNQKPDSYRVRVLNGGRSGLSMRHHLLQMEILLEEFPEIDGVIMLAGINDLLRNIDKGIPEPDREKDMKEAFLSMPPFDPPFLNSRLLYLLQKAGKEKPVIPKSLVQDRAGQVYAQWRQHRQIAEADSHFVTAPIRPECLQLRGLEYVRELSEQHGVKVLVLTQPTLWSDTLEKAQRELLWMGGKSKYPKALGGYQEQPGSAYYSVATLENAMAQMNVNTRQQCLALGLEFLDLAGDMRAIPACFYDDCHFTEKGARAVADFVVESVAGFLLQRH